MGGADVTEENFDNSGIVAETNGNLTLLSNQGTEETFSYIRAVRNDIYNFDQTSPGTTAQTVNVGGYMSDHDNDPATAEIFIELGELDLAENWDPSFTGTDLEGELILDPNIVLTPEQQIALVIENDIPGTGGNLQVGGNANVDGVLSVADNGAGGVADVDAAINGNTDAIAQEVIDRVADVNAEEARALLAEQANTDAIAQEVIDRVADVNAEEARALLAEQANTDAIAQEVLDRSKLIRSTGINADGNQIVHIGDNSLVTQELGGEQQLFATDALGNAIDINVLNGSNLLINGDSVATENYVDAADARLQEQIDTNVRDIAKNREDIDANTRGIAMVAALQHTTVLPGMTNALDISAAHFEGETGMALNYARRINENVQINFGAASTTDFDESVIKAGVGIQW